MRVAAYAVILFIMVTFPVCAEEKQDTGLSSAELENMLVIDEVEVKGELTEESIEGKTVINEETIKMLPRGNGDITEALRIAPGVQFDDDYRDSLTAGEIEPGRISISGGKDYQNLFMLDGMSNSSILNPAEESIYDTDNVSGNPQKFFIDSSIVKKVTVFDSNVPVKYGGFLGGVVDVETIDPTQNVWGNISYRTTRSEWANFYVDEIKQDDFENSNDSQKGQPKFEKHHFNATLNTPVTDKLAVVFNYKKLESTIPVRFYNKWQDEERLNETFLVKGLLNISSSSYLDATVSYAPYKQKIYFPNVKNSGFDVHGGGYYAAVNYTKESGDSKLEIHADYSVSENSRDASNVFYHWATTSSKDWGYMKDPSSVSEGSVGGSYEGGYGDLYKSESVFNFKLDHDPFRFKFGGDHVVSYGFHYSNIKGIMDKSESSYLYKDPVVDSDVICGGQQGVDCLEGEQYFSEKTIAPSFKNEALINTVNFYAQDEYDIWRLNFRLGLRYTYDDYMENHDIAPRTSFEYDIFDSKRTVLLAGYNRYYGTNLLDNKLREEQPDDLEYIRSTYRNEVQDWITVTPAVDTVYKYSDLNTPYSDEYMVGVAQYLLGGTLNLKYITRDNKDEFASEIYSVNGKKYRKLNNNGESSFESFQIKWDRSWKNHYVMLNAMWQESETAQDSYDDEYDLEDLDKDILYNGSKIKLAELPKDNFNRPITVNLTYTGKFFKHLSVSPVIKYRSSYRDIRLVNGSQIIGTTGETDPETGAVEYKTIASYKDVTFNHSVLVDLRFSWEQPVYKTHTIKVSFDINNLFDRKIVKGYGSTSDSEMYEEYELGRSFWAGVEYAF